MIRFAPDSLLDAVLRPLDMISPESNIYLEIPAPDIRLAAALVLALAVLVAARKRPDRGPALLLVVLTLAAMVPWLATSGNGRYFTSFLLVLGPLCVGLVRLLPLSTSMKFAAIGLLLLVQGVLVFEAAPWGRWSHMPWRSTYFGLATPPAEPRSYVTLSPQSHSLIAPLFPEQSRWMNLSAPVPRQREREYAHKWFAAARSLYLVAIAFPPQMDPDKQPSRAVREVFNHLIGPRGLSLANDARCDFLPSTGLADLATAGKGVKDPAAMARYGFWLCPLRYKPTAVAETSGARQYPELDPVFEAVEKLCPRFFPPGQAHTWRNQDVVMRHYAMSDTNVFVLDDGAVRYKFWQSLNAVTIGSREDLLAGRVRLDCAKIRASNWRSGGP